MLLESKLAISMVFYLLICLKSEKSNFNFTSDETAKVIVFPPIQYMPSPQHPFIFLHIEKSAGSSLRMQIAESADSIGLKHLIPCHGPIHCVTLNLTEPFIYSHNLDNVSVVAGHFFWNVWNYLSDYDKSSTLPSIFVIGRHPVSRAISFYYQRCYIVENCIGFQKPLNDLAVEDLEIIISGRRAEPGADGKTMYIVDEGIEDAACRILANEKFSSGLLVSNLIDGRVPRPPPITNQTVARALNNIDFAVIGILEDWNGTLDVMRHWFPWIDMSRNLKVLNDEKLLYIKKESLEELRDDLRFLIERSNECDMVLYNRMKNRFRQQLNSISLTFSPK